MPTLRLIILLTLAGLAGCSQQPLSPAGTGYQAPPPVYTPGELNGEIIYDLVSAELAGRQQHYSLALQNYLKQARLTADRNVIARTVHIAQFTRDPQAIEAAARVWIEHYPADQRPNELLAGLLLHQQRYQEAMPFIRQTLTLHSNQMLLLLSSQAERIPTAQSIQIAQLLEQQLQQHDQHAQLWLTYAALQQRLQQPEKALASINKAHALQPDSLEVALQQADLLRQLQRYPQALAQLQRLQRQAPDDEQIDLLYIRTLHQAGRHPQARQHARQLLQRQPDNTKLQFYLALLALDFNQLEDSRALLQPLADNPDDSSGHFYLGLIAEQQQQIDTALAHYRLVNHGNNISSAVARSLRLLTTDQHAQANQLVQQTEQAHPELGPALLNLYAQWLQEHDRAEQASTLLDEALQRYPDDLDLLYSRAMLRPEAEFALAEQSFRHILAQQPDNAMALNALGYTLTLYTDRHQEARRLLMRALALRPDDPAVIDSVGWNLYHLGQYQAALTHLERAYQLFNNDEVGYHLLVVLTALNQFDRAAALYQQIITTFPDTPYQQPMQDALDNRP